MARKPTRSKRKQQQNRDLKLKSTSDPELCCEEGERLLKSGKPADALRFFEKAVEADPSIVRGLFGLGLAYSNLEAYADSLPWFRKALVHEPKLSIAHHNLAKSLHELGQADEAYQHFKWSRQHANDLTATQTSIATAVPGFPSATNPIVLQERSEWSGNFQFEPVNRSTKSTDNQRIKIAYVSAFFHKENWMKPVWALMANHNRKQFEIHLISDRTSLTPQIRNRLIGDDTFHDVSELSNQELSEHIAKIGIDILIDLNSYSFPQRFPVFVRRPAAINVAWFNLYATTGFECFDYLIGDPCVAPESEAKFYTEKILRVPGSYLTFNVDYKVPDIVPPPVLSNGFITFGSLTSQYKITNQVVATWAEILRQVPTSRLLIRNAGLKQDGSRKFLLDLFLKEGIEKDRLELLGPAEHFKFLETYGRLDVALDAFPYNGGTTTTEAIWQGVPVVAYWGDRWVSRTSATLLRNGGLGDLVGEDVSDYVRIACGLANDVPRLENMRTNMRSKLLDATVCDSVGFALEMENLYHQIWEQHSNQVGSS